MRIEQLTFTRFVAAFFILVYHFGKKTFPFNWEPAYMFIKQTNVGVSYFYILSGYVMILAHYRGKEKTIQPAEFYIKRFARVYPIYFIAIVLSALFILFKKEKVSVIAFLLELTGLQSWVPSYALEINYTAWSVSNEIFFFVLFPYLFNSFYLKKPLLHVGLYVIVIWILSQCLFNVLLKTDFYQGYPSTSHEALYYHPLMHLSEFLIGNIAGLYFMLHLKNKNVSGNYDVVVILLVLLLIACMSHPFINYHNGVLAMVFVPFLIFLSLNTGLITRLFLKPLPVLLGEISYGFYILQMPVFWVCKFIYLKLHINYGKFPLFYFGFAVLLLASYLSYLMVEKPLRSWLQESLKRKLLRTNTTAAGNT
jgi:peptidoglycan/LPS O-acetylase OafA/YrhL